MNSIKKPLSKLSLAYSTWDENEISAMNNVINSGTFTMGKSVKEFEDKFSKYIGTNYSVMVNSGSSANLLMVAALFAQKKLKKGDEIIVPACFMEHNLPASSTIWP